MKVRYKGTTFGGGVLGLTDGKTYECVGVEYDLLRIIDDEELKRYSKNWHRPAVSKDLDKPELFMINHSIVAKTA